MCALLLLRCGCLAQIVVVCVSSFLLVLCGFLDFVVVSMDSRVGLVVVFMARSLDAFSVDCRLFGCFISDCVDVVNCFLDCVSRNV